MKQDKAAVASFCGLLHCWGFFFKTHVEPLNTVPLVGLAHYSCISDGERGCVRPWGLCWLLLGFGGGGGAQSFCCSVVMRPVNSGGQLLAGGCGAGSYCHYCGVSLVISADHPAFTALVLESDGGEVQVWFCFVSDAVADYSMGIPLDAGSVEPARAPLSFLQWLSQPLD